MWFLVILNYSYLLPFSGNANDLNWGWGLRIIYWTLYGYWLSPEKVFYEKKWSSNSNDLKNKRANHQHLAALFQINPLSIITSQSSAAPRVRHGLGVWEEADAAAAPLQDTRQPQQRGVRAQVRSQVIGEDCLLHLRFERHLCVHKLS